MNKYEKAACVMSGLEGHYVEVSDDALYVSCWNAPLDCATDIRMHEEQVDEYSSLYDEDPQRYQELEKEFLNKHVQ
jgi:transcription elongation factor Elf1